MPGVRIVAIPNADHYVYLSDRDQVAEEMNNFLDALRWPTTLLDIIPQMNTPQAGIFALGTSSHAYLEFNLVDVQRREAFAASIASIHEPRTTTGGVNFVIGFRPELWREMAPADLPPDVTGFNIGGTKP